MLGTADEVQARIRAGEDSFVEFKGLPLGKRSVISPNAEAFAGEMVAFANAEGGAILLGIQDDGTVEGIAESELGTVEQWVVNVATNGCDPPIRPVIRKVLLPGEDGVERAVFVVEVKQSLYVHATTNGRWLVRVGSSKRRLTSQELPRLFQQRGRAYVFDEQPVMTATADALDRRALERFFSGPLGIPWEELLKKTRVLAQDEEGVDRPTVAALLAFSEMPEEHLLSAKIRLFLFSDRLELYSPGALPNTLTLEDMPYRVLTRNQLLVGFLSRMHGERTGRVYLESRGEGVRRILEESERHSGRRPEYRLLGQELLLTIWAQPSPHEDGTSP